MAGCLSNSAVVNSHNTHVKQPLIHETNKHKYNFGIPTNYQTEYLVLLNDDDMNDKKTFFWLNKSIKTKLLNKKHKFPGGKLTVLGINDIEKEQNYIIEDIPTPNEIYMKLPDKNLYVLSSKYNLKYFDAKQNELKNIFILLGAKKITMQITKNNTINKSIGAEIGVNLPNLDIGENVYLENNNSLNNQQTTEMEFDYDEKIMNNIDPSVFSDKNFHFLPKEYDWQNIIIQRLEKKQTSVKHKFIYKNTLSFKSNFSTKLKMMNVNFNYNTDELDNVEITYEVEYHKLSENITDAN